MPRTSLAHLVLLACLAACPASEYPPLAAIDYDTVFLTNGSNLVGLITEELPEGAVRLRQISQTSGSGALISADQIQRIERRCTLASALRRRGELAIAAGDWFEVQRTLRFALERKPNVSATAADLEQALRTEAVGLAEKALVLRPVPELAALAVAMAEARSDWPAVVRAARAGLGGDANWTAGYEALARALTATGSEQDLRALLKEWLDRQPTSREANRLFAGLAEKDGDLRGALRAYQKGFDLYKDPQAAVGFARLALRRGDTGEADRAARWLLEQQEATAAAKTLFGSALVARIASGAPGDLAEAVSAFQSALADPGLDPGLADLARYNLAWAHWRSGRQGEAVKLWRDCKDPAAKVALAVAQGRPADAGAAPPALRALAAEHNAILDLRSGRTDQALAALDPGSSRRHGFLALTARVVATNGAGEAVKQLMSHPGAESSRWQAWGHLSQGRLNEAEAALSQLPATDGYAIACQVYLALLRKDQAAARRWYERLTESSDPPRDYVNRLRPEFDSANDEVVREGFDWPDPDTVPIGWQAEAPGTGIRIHPDNGRLVLEGVQAEGSSAPSQAWRMVSAQRFRSAQVDLDLSTAGNATCGLLLMDETRRQGLALGVRGANAVWRRLAEGKWDAWQPLGDAFKPGQPARLRIEVEGGTFYAVPIDRPQDRLPLPGAGPGRSDGLWAIGVFGQADPKTSWRMSADDLILQIRPVSKK